MAVHANLIDNTTAIYKNTTLSAVLLSQPFWVDVNASNYPDGELAKVYNGYTVAPLNRGSQFSLLDDDTLIYYEVESELSAADEDGHAHATFPRLFASALSSDSGTDNVLNIDDTSGTNFQVNDWVGITDDSGDFQVNKITGISSGQLTFLNNFSKNWTIASNSLVGYGVRHHYGGDTSSNQSNKESTWEASYEMVQHLNQDKPEGAFDDSTSNNNNGTNVGTIDAVGAIDRGRDFDGTNDAIIVADSNSLSFGDGSSDDPFSIEISPNMDDASRFRLVTKGVDINDREYAFHLGGTDKLQFVLYDANSGNLISATSDAALTADENSEISLGGSYNGSGSALGITLYRNGAVLASTPNTVGTYVAMHNTAATVKIGRFFDGATANDHADGTIDEATISRANRSLDWFKARNQSRLGTWLSFGAEEIVSGIVPTLYYRRLMAGGIK